jgi:hypothetical protein
MSKEGYYLVLGLKPGSSAQQLKDAYRDLAKVWHPDRFAHDPKLQQKAQEKLKEINEAYAQLTSPAAHRATRRHAPDAPKAEHTRSRRSAGAPSGVRDSPPKTRLAPYALAAFGFTAVLFLSFILLRADGGAPVAVGESPARQPSAESGAVGAEPAGRKENKTPDRPKASAGLQADGTTERVSAPETAAATAAAESSAGLRPLPTVVRTIDPETGLLATRACPIKSPMTYPAGQEPRDYCEADHGQKRAQESQKGATGQAQAEGRSSMKAVVDAVKSPGKLFRKKKEQPAGQ